MSDCVLCGEDTEALQGAPWLSFKGNAICSGCYVGLIGPIYRMAGYGDGGMIHLLFDSLLRTGHNRKHRVRMSQYRSTLKKLLHKYKFSCVHCGSRDEATLTIDHIKPVSKGGTDDFDNLQILCKSCNSRKGNRE